MKSFSLLAAVLALGLTFTTADAEAAKRLGSGSSSGMQRQMNVPDKTPGMASSQAPTASAAAKSPATAAAAAQTPPKRSWMGPLAGLAAGLGLAALASHLGFGEELASMLMIGVLVMAALAVVGYIMRRRAAAQRPAMVGAGAGSTLYAGTGSAPATAFPKAYEPAMPPSGDVAVRKDATGYDVGSVSGNNLPADFDVAGFVRQAKVNFIRLQAANDAGNLDDLREFTTPEMFAELKTTILARGDAVQQTDVLEIDADVLEIVEEASRYVASVRYGGLIREDKDAAAETVDEIWHLVKPRNGNGGWLLAGVQQI
ncbi:MAG: Tim44-like domain-containing protein [Rhodocyclaceae bacterium]